MPKKIQADYSKFCMSPMPGAIISCDLKVGQTVIVNQELIVMEAMKMQNILRSKVNGVIKKINCKPGDVVSNNFKLIEFE
jgi:propionyl-CoA carboxylase alpha chain